GLRSAKRRGDVLAAIEKREQQEGKENGCHREPPQGESSLYQGAAVVIQHADDYQHQDDANRGRHSEAVLQDCSGRGTAYGKDEYQPGREEEFVKRPEPAEQHLEERAVIASPIAARQFERD